MISFNFRRGSILVDGSVTVAQSGSNTQAILDKMIDDITRELLNLYTANNEMGYTFDLQHNPVVQLPQPPTLPPTVPTIPPSTTTANSKRNIVYLAFKTYFICESI